MGAIIIDGRALSESLMPEVRRQARELIEDHHFTPGLAAILVGDDFHGVSLIAFLASVGLGSDGLSSPFNGAEEAFVSESCAIC